MSNSIRIGSEFLSMTHSEDRPWIRNIYWGPADGTNRHAHLAVSGSAVLAEIWYARDINGNEIIRNGSEVTNNTSQLLLDCIPMPLRELQHPEQPLSWNVGSLDSFFSLHSSLKHLGSTSFL